MTEWNANYPTPPHPQGKRMPAWAVVLICVGVLLAVVCSVAFVAVSLQRPADPGWTVQPSSSTSAPAPAKTSSAATPAAAAPAGQIGEGTYEVGPEIAPGKYKSAGAKPSAFQLCTWTVKGSDGKVIDLGSAGGEAEQQLVTLKAGQVFESSGCHPWVKVG